MNVSGVIFNSSLFRVSGTDLSVVLNIDNIPSGAPGSNYDTGVTQISYFIVRGG